MGITLSKCHIAEGIIKNWIRRFNHADDRAFIVTQTIKKLNKDDKAWALGKTGFCQVMGGLDNTLFIDVLDHGNAHFFLKCPGQVVWVNLYHVGDVLDGQMGG